MWGRRCSEVGEGEAEGEGLGEDDEAGFSSSTGGRMVWVGVATAVEEVLTLELTGLLGWSEGLPGGAPV